MANEHINALRSGVVVEEYRIERLLGHGGFGMTYLARDLNLNTLVALKEYLPQEFAVRAANSTIVPKSSNDEQGYTWGLERFKQEARALARFKHPHIVRASRLIESNNTAYMVMDYEQGMTLGIYLKKHGPTIDEAKILGVFLPILDGLHALHKAELVHRDIKPGNIYIRAEGGPMLIDFGAVRHAIGAHSRSLTAVVTPGFAPIEQYSSEGKQGPWTDLYAVGATMYTCILGRAPVDAARRSAAISDGDPDPLVSAARVGKGKYSDQFLAAIDWALQFRTKDRPQSAVDFKEALRKSPHKPEAMELESDDEDKTAMGAVQRESWVMPPPADAPPRSKPVPFGAEPETMISQPRRKADGAPSQPIPSGDADVASAPMEWFEPEAEAAPQKTAPQKTTPAAPRGQPTRDPEQDPLSQTHSGMIAKLAAGEAPPRTAKMSPQPTAPAAKAPPPEKPAPSAKGAAMQPSPKPAPASKPPVAAGGLIANASARSEPRRGGGLALKLLAVLVVLGAAGAGVYWYQSGAADRRDAKLWAAAGRSGSIAGYQSYLAGCEQCAKKDEANAAITRLGEAAQAAAASDEQLQRVAALKGAFAQHLMAGEIDQPVGDNARTVLDELGRIAPDDVFVISGRERLALLEKERQTHGAKPAATAAVAPAVVAPVANTPAAATAPPVAPAVAVVAPAKGKAPAKTPPRGSAPTKTETVAVAPAAPAPVVNTAPVIDQTALLFDLLAKFEIALSKGDIDGGPNSASVSLRALETVAPDDPIVKDVRRRYESTKAKAEAAARVPAPVVAAPVVAAAAPAASRPAPDATTSPGDDKPAPANDAAPANEPANVPPAGTTVRDQLGPFGTGPALVAIAAGSFRMGDLQGDGNPDERPITNQRIKAFAIAKRETSVAQFRLFSESTGYVTDAERSGGCRVQKDGAWVRDPRFSWRKPPFSQTDEEPVVCVSASDAGAYTQWLSQVSGLRYRLPTEAEWEYAARAGSEAPWWWGTNVSTGLANCEGCEGKARARTVEGATFGKNAWGLFDTAGNVWEWTCSSYAPKLDGGENQCVNLKSENQIVMRGGSWATPIDRLRSSVRGYAAMSYSSDNAGFRVAREF